MKKIIKVMLMLSMLLTITGCKQENFFEKVKEVTELPIVYVNTVNNEPINKVEKENKDAEFRIEYTDGTSLELLKDEQGNYPMTIKGRGNSSWGMPTTKKPYNIKFEEKQDLFGFGAAKKWSLIAGWFDTSFVRSYIGYKLAGTLDETTPDCEMVELVVNGVYEGVYMLCEAYGINKNRVETKDDGQDINGDGEITEYLIEADVRAEEYNEPLRFTIDNNYWMVVKEPDEDDITSLTDERYTYVSEHFQKVNDAIMSLDNYQQYIDVDSLASQYVINEYLKNPDWGFGNQPYYASTFMYMEEGGKIYFGPFWDCDISMGRVNYSEIESEGYRKTNDPEGFLAKQTHWINKLMEDTSFVSLVEAKWEILKTEVETMINTTAPEMMDKIALVQEYDFKAHKESAKKRTVDWVYRVPLAFEDECQYVLDFMKTRLTWMDEQYGK